MPKFRNPLPPTVAPSPFDITIGEAREGDFVIVGTKQVYEVKEKFNGFAHVRAVPGDDISKLGNAVPCYRL